MNSPTQNQIYIFRPHISAKNMLLHQALCWDVETVRYGDSLNNDTLNAVNICSIQAIVPVNILTKKSKKFLDLLEHQREITIGDVEFIQIWFDFGDAVVTVENFLDFRATLSKHNGFTFNGLRFDLAGLVKVSKREFEITHTKQVRIKNGKKTTKDNDLRGWADSCGLKNLKAIGDEINCPKFDIDAKNHNDWIDYGHRDTEILARFIHYLNLINIDNSHMPVFVRSKMSELLIERGIKEVHTNSLVDDFISHGARCEAYSNFKRGDCYLDVNSEYPYVMANFEYPAFIEKENKEGKIALVSFKSLRSTYAQSIKDKINKIDLDEIESIDNAREIYNKIFGKNLYCLKVTINECPEHRLHCFSFGYKDNNSTKFQFKENQEYEVIGYEILFLRDYEYDIVSVNISKSSNHFASEFIKKTFAERKALNDHAKKFKLPKPAQQQTLKIFLNASFGIYGAKGNRQSIATLKKDKEKFAELRKLNDSVYDKDTSFTMKSMVTFNHDNTMTVYFMHGLSLKKKAAYNPRYCRNTIPTIAIFTLSHARFLIHFYQRKIEAGGGILRYTDTDSIICDAVGYEIMQNLGAVGDDFGQLKLEMTIDEGACIGSKLYIIKDTKGKIHTAAKGVRSFVQETTYNTQSVHKNFATIVRSPFDRESGQKRTPKIDSDGHIYFANFSTDRKVEEFFTLGQMAADLELKYIHKDKSAEDFDNTINWSFV